MNIKQLDWNEYHTYIDKLAHKIKLSQKKYMHIAAIDTDDMLVAIHLSHRLNVPCVTDINILSLLANYSDDFGFLVVANIVENGKSFNDLKEETKCNFDTGVLFYDKNSEYVPTFYVEIPTDKIYFPWQKCGIQP